jgi:tRNA(Arg) A34 adenosine deaminase TadA
MNFRSRLRKVAVGSTHPRYLHAALVTNGKRFAWDSNTGYTHAEIGAIKDFVHAFGPQFLRGATLHTLMVKRSTGELGEATPCQECMDAIRAAGIRKVVVYV